VEINRKNLSALFPLRAASAELQAAGLGMVSSINSFRQAWENGFLTSTRTQAKEVLCLGLAGTDPRSSITPLVAARINLRFEAPNSELRNRGRIPELHALRDGLLRCLGLLSAKPDELGQRVWIIEVPKWNVSNAADIDPFCQPVSLPERDVTP
jgi:hypothetical protein